MLAATVAVVRRRPSQKLRELVALVDTRPTPAFATRLAALGVAWLVAQETIERSLSAGRLEPATFGVSGWTVVVATASLTAAILTLLARAGHALAAVLVRERARGRSPAKVLQQFTLSVPTEKEGATTTKIELAVPSGFAIDSFEPESGWTREVKAQGSGEEAVVQDVTWSGGAVPTDEDAVLRFAASATTAKTFTFTVRQSYSDGTVVDWSGPESSDTPAPTIDAVSSLGGGGSSTLAIVAIVARASPFSSGSSRSPGASAH